MDEIQLRRGGRFLQRIDDPQEARALGVPHSANNAWKIADEFVAMEKCKQSLRDKDPAHSRSAITAAHDPWKKSEADHTSANSVFSHLLQGAASIQTAAPTSMAVTNHPVQPYGDELHQARISTSSLSRYSDGVSSASNPIAAECNRRISGGLLPAVAGSNFEPTSNRAAIQNLLLLQQASLPLSNQQYQHLQLPDQRLQFQLARLQHDRLMENLSRSDTAIPLPTASILQSYQGSRSQSSHPTSLTFDWQAHGRPTFAGTSNFNINPPVVPLGDQFGNIPSAFSAAALPGFSVFGSQGGSNTVQPSLRDYLHGNPLSISNETLRRALLLQQLEQQMPPAVTTTNDSAIDRSLPDHESRIVFSRSTSLGTEGAMVHRGEQFQPSERGGRHRRYTSTTSSDEEKSPSASDGSKRARHCE